MSDWEPDDTNPINRWLRRPPSPASAPPGVTSLSAERRRRVQAAEEEQEQESLRLFHDAMMRKVHQGVAEGAARVQAVRERGELPFDVGTRFHTPHSKRNGLRPWQVIGHFVDQKDPQTYGYRVQRGQEEDPDYERSQLYVSNPKGQARTGVDYPALAAQFEPFTGLTRVKADGGEVDDPWAAPMPRETMKQKLLKNPQVRNQWPPGPYDKWRVRGASTRGDLREAGTFKQEKSAKHVADYGNRLVDWDNNPTPGRRPGPVKWRVEPIPANDEKRGGLARADGGQLETQTTVGHKLHVGPIHSAVAGRTDHLPMHVPSGAYVVPADIISSMGEGNTIAGFKHMRRMFGGVPYGGGSEPYGHEGGPYSRGEHPYDQTGGPYREPLPHAAGGGSRDTEGQAVPIVAAGGEYVLSPEQVRRAGEGDLDLGHKVLDEFVKRMRAQTVKTLQKLPGPKKD